MTHEKMMVIAKNRREKKKTARKTKKINFEHKQTSVSDCGSARTLSVSASACRCAQVNITNKKSSHRAHFQRLILEKRRTKKGTEKAFVCVTQRKLDKRRRGWWSAEISSKGNAVANRQGQRSRRGRRLWTLGEHRQRPRGRARSLEALQP
jgi:hypothetical protein